MNTPRSTVWAERIIFYVCLAATFWFYTTAVYDYGHRHGAASVKVPVCKPAALARQQIRGIVFQTAKECRA
jgi:hypothetical protein